MSRLAILALTGVLGCAHHYGYQVAASDVVGWELVREGDRHDSLALEIAGYGALIGGAPAVHAAHGNWGRAAISLGLRAGITAIAAGSGPDASEGTGDEGPAIRGMVTALLVVAGILGVEAFDALALAYDPASDPGPAPPRMLSIGGGF